MKIYLSLENVPELAGLTSSQRRGVLVASHHLMQMPSFHGFRFKEVGFVGLVILAEIAGFIGGFVYWRSPFWGPLAGAVLALFCVMVAVYGVSMFIMGPKVRRFLQSTEGQKLIEWAKTIPAQPVGAPNGAPRTSPGNPGPPPVN